MWYVINFRTTDLGLAPTFARYEKLATGDAVTPQPAILAIGVGLYKFEATPAEDLVFVVDGGAGITDPEVRYVRGMISPQDARLDAAISSRAAIADWTTPRAAKLDQLDAAISSRSTPAEANAIATSLLTAIGTRAAAADLTTLATALAAVGVNAERAQAILSGRWKINPTSKQLTIYQGNTDTALLTFSLLDAAGEPNISQPFERRPV